MKNLRMKQKLLISFSIIVLLSILVGISGMVGLSDSSDQADMIHTIHQNSLMVQKFQTNLETQRSLYRDATLRVAVNVTDGLEEELLSIEVLDTEARQMLAEFETSFTQDESYEILVDVKSSYEEFSVARDLLLASLRSSAEIETLVAYIGQAASHANELHSHTGVLTGMATRITDEIVTNTQLQSRFLTRIMVTILTASVIISIVLALYISGLIANPIAKLVEAADQFSIGNLQIQLQLDRRDEIGKLSQAFANMANEVKRQAQILFLVAEGNYTQMIPIRSSDDVMNGAINEMITKSSTAIEKVLESAMQIDCAAAQISQASQNLAAGSGEQAATLADFTAKITDISANAEKNTNTASAALQNNQQSDVLMQESIDAMNQMVAAMAMASISSSSQDISRIIKVIDDIAFQTNILSLNAAVEAARAGVKGKGFAVVADEVRNLAAKSAEAAKNTADLISNSSAQVDIGNEIVSRVECCLQDIVEYAQKNTLLIQEINASSLQQSEDLVGVTKGIHEITAVVQSNSATAEETAAASQEMAAQSAMLRNALSVFRTKDDTLQTAMDEAASKPTQQTQAREENRQSPVEHGMPVLAGIPGTYQSGMRLIKGGPSKY